MTFFSHVENAEGKEYNKGRKKMGPWNAHCNSNVFEEVEFKKKKEKNLLTGTVIVGDGC